MWPLNENLSILDVLTVFSVLLQISGVQSDMRQASNDELLHELQHQNKAYLEKILQNQELILEKLAALRLTT